MESTVVNALTHLGGSLVSFLVGWRMNKKKTNAEIRGLEMDNVSEAIEIWKEMAVSFQAQCTALTMEVKLLRTENFEVTTKMNLLSIECSQLREDMRQLSNQNFKLQSELHEYNQNNSQTIN
jgi:hypothetical protein